MAENAPDYDVLMIGNERITDETSDEDEAEYCEPKKGQHPSEHSRTEQSVMLEESSTTINVRGGEVQAKRAVEEQPRVFIPVVKGTATLYAESEHEADAPKEPPKSSSTCCFIV
jgi:hypothetical protein